MTSVRILIVRAEEPGEDGLAGLAACLREMGHTVRAGTAGEAADQAARARPDLALIDLGCDGAGGEAAAADAIEATERLARGFDLPVIYLTGRADGARLQRARLTGPCGHLLKPIDDRQLLLTMEAALAMHDRDRARRRTIDELRQQTQLMETVLDLVGDGVVVAEELGDPTIFNASAERIIGVRRTDGGPDHWGDGYGMFHADEVTPVRATNARWSGPSAARRRTRSSCSYATATGRLEDAERRALVAGVENVVEWRGTDSEPEPRLFHRSKMAVRDDRAHDGPGEVIGELYVYRDVSKAIEPSG